MKQALILVILTTAVITLCDKPQVEQNEAIAKAMVYPDQRGLDDEFPEALS